MVRVLYDDQIFSLQPWGGISTCYVELLKRLHGDEDVQAILALGDTDNGAVKELPAYRGSADRFGPLRKRVVDNYGRYRHKDIRRWLNRRISVQRLRRQEFDILHPTYYEPYFLPHLGEKPFVLTIHDMIYEMLFPDEMEFIEAKKELAEAADRIVAVSENTKRDVVRSYGLAPSRVEVIHLGSPVDRYQAPAPPFDNYLLYVGKRASYKNFMAFAEAVAPLLKKDRALSIACGGGPLFDQEEMRAFERLGISGQVKHMEVTEETLQGFYQHALAHVLPSLHEGFGLPALESMARSCPTVLSDRGSLPEVGGSAAVYFDPESPEAIRSAVESVIYDPSRREALSEMGRARAAEFSWDRNTAEHKALYKSMV